MPYTRIFAAFMLATLISTLFALPAQAAPNELDVVVAGPASVLSGVAYSYTVTVTNNSGHTATAVSLTDTMTAGATFVGTPAGCALPAGSPPSTVCTLGDIADGAFATVTINVTAGAVGTATNTVSLVNDLELDATSVGSTLVANTPVNANGDLQVTKKHTGTTTPGGALTYTITVHNAGPNDATGVTLSDTAPTGVTFGTVTVVSNPVLGGPSTCALPGATSTSISCTGWTIPNGTTVTVTVLATLSLTATGSIANTAAITADAVGDSVSSNNSATDTFTVGVASVDMAVAIAVAPSPAAPGDTVTYTVTVTNRDLTTDATNVVVTDTLPAGLTAVTPPTDPAAGNGTVVLAGNTWTWTIPTVVKATASAPTVVTATIDAIVDPTTTLTSITNSVTMTATQTNTTPANNAASVDLQISAEVADLNIITGVDDSKPNKGDTIHIYLQVSNTGPADATNIVVKDVLPTGLKYLSCQPTGCDQTGLRRQSSQTFSIPSVLAGDAQSVILAVQVQASSGTLQNTASIQSADQTDPTSADTSDSLSITIGGAANNPGGPTGGTGGTGGTGTTGGTTGGTAFTGFTAGQLMPWFMLLFSLGLVAVEWSRRMRLVSPIGSTYGFEPPF
ncbi:MAG: hypothetical protein ACXVEI_01190 [Actinomycetota bacterium]